MEKLFYLLRLLARTPSTFLRIRKIKLENLSYKSFKELAELDQVIERIRNKDLDGSFIEAGTALGGSALIISAAKNKATPFHLYDTFEMIPPPSEKDGADVHQRYEVITKGEAVGIKGDTYYGYQDNLFEQVQNSFDEFGMPISDYNVFMHKGLFEDTLQVDGPVALAHLDCDWYDSVTVCLERIVPNLVDGGVLVIDDYKDWSGCKQAIDDFFDGRMDEFEFEFTSQLLIWKK